MSRRTLRMGVLGCADIAVRRMLPAMAALPDIEITAVASRERSKAEKTATPYGAAPVTGYAELLRRDDVDAVYAPLPASMHEEWVEAALRAGKHTLAEKPLTLDSGRTARLLDLAQGMRLGLMENVMFVHHHMHAAVTKLVADGAVGELRAFEAAFTIPRLPADDIRYNPGLGGGALWDVGVYPLRAAMHMLGTELEVVGAHLARGAGMEVDTAGAALLRRPDGVTAHVVFGMEHAYRATYALHGSEGRITVERAYTPPADHRPAVRLERAGGTEEIPLEPDDQVANTLKSFANGVRSAAGHPFDRATALRQAELLDVVRTSALHPAAPPAAAGTRTG